MCFWIFRFSWHRHISYISQLGLVFKKNIIFICKVFKKCSEKNFFCFVTGKIQHVKSIIQVRKEDYTLSLSANTIENLNGYDRTIVQTKDQKDDFRTKKGIETIKIYNKGCWSVKLVLLSINY